MQEKLEKEHLRNEFDIWVGFGNWASWADQGIYEYYFNRKIQARNLNSKSALHSSVERVAIFGRILFGFDFGLHTYLNFAVHT